MTIDDVLSYWEEFNAEIDALRAQQEAEKNEPLTLDELREMGGEPVLVICDEEATKTTPGFQPLEFWALVEVEEESIWLTNNLGGRTEYAADVELENDGITIYRHKPKEETTLNENDYDCFTKELIRRCREDGMGEADIQKRIKEV